MSIEFPYLIGIALIEEGGKRAMPLGGKSIKKALTTSENPGSKGNLITLELLFRVVQRGDNAYVKRHLNDKSILVIQMSMKAMQDKLPKIKNEWLKTGDSMKLIKLLKESCQGVWSINFIKHTGITYELL